jgi:uncharacterized protein YvpB
MLFLLLIGNSVNAEELSEIEVSEIGSTYIIGTYNGEETINVYNGTSLLGSGNSTSNTYKINFTQPLIGQNQLTLKIDGKDFVKEVTYAPPSLDHVDDKSKVISGQIAPGSTIQASINGVNIPLEEYNNHFKSKPSPMVSYGAIIEAVSVANNIRSVVTTKVTAAPAPLKPKVNPVSNKNTYISGYAEPGSTVVIQAGKTKYNVKASVTSGYYRIIFPNKRPLPAGTVVSIYANADRHNSRSTVVTIKVTDKIAPAAPKVNKLTNKAFAISGSAEANSTLYVFRNAKKYKTVKVNSKGKFYIRVPLQAAKTRFELYAKDLAGNQGSKTRIVVSNQKRPVKKLMYTPVIRQMPELPRGCEVTSLTMMLNQAGVKANKMTLAKQVKKDPTIYRYSKGRKYFGNPNYGFVGNMYTFSKPGFGVFNKPIAELANSYMPGRIVNLSGQSFETVLNYVGAGRPVWVINTSWFSYVPSKYWQTWYTPQGPVRITMKEHSVLITGYDSKYVYFNDPLDGTKNKKRLKKHFVEGWTQYGKQAISYY